VLFKNVLVGVDGRPNGQDAIALASLLADPEGELTLACVHQGEMAEDREAARTLLERERDAAHVQAKLLDVVSVGAGRGLHEQAERQGADLLVVGSCSHSAFGRAMLGDDTRAALNGAPCTVAVAPRGYAQDPQRIVKVGVAYNASPESIAALTEAKELAALTGATTHAVEVVSIPSTAYAGIVVPTFESYINQILREAEGRLAELPGVEGHAVYGIAGEELAAFGDQVDILVVGSRGYGPVKRLVAGSTCDYLERHARCALLVLPRIAISPGEDSTASDELQAKTAAGTAI
jgi:nucleotide-binding universal stress UspA family protein